MFEVINDEKNEFIQGNAKIKVIGIGGGGCNAVNTMIRSGLEGVEYIVANTDAQALNINLAPTKIQLGSEITKGLGAGANPEVGRKAALEDYQKLGEVLAGADMVFVTCGMGGGTGTGAAPVIAKLSKELGALTVGVVTKPFLFEGKKRSKQAEKGISSLEDNVDSLICIPNQRLLYLAGDSLSLVDTFKKADDVLLNAVRGISDLINSTGLINADFADVSTIMANKGLALMGTGVAEGQDRAIKAATLAISSPLLEDVSIDGATGIIINITASSSLTTHEVNEATTLIMEAADEDAEIIFGTVIDEEMESNLKVTVIATGLNQKGRNLERAIESEEIQSAHNVEERTSFVVSSINRSENNLVSEVEASKKIVESDTIYSRESVHMPESLSQSIKKESISSNDGNRNGLSEKIQKHLESSSSNMNDLGMSSQRTSLSQNEERINQSRSLKNESPRIKSIAERLGFINFEEDEFDHPAFLKKNNESSVNKNEKLD